jgi:hypothetical protein
MTPWIVCGPLFFQRKSLCYQSAAFGAWGNIEKLAVDFNRSKKGDPKRLGAIKLPNPLPRTLVPQREKLNRTPSHRTPESLSRSHAGLFDYRER